MQVKKLQKVVIQHLSPPGPMAPDSGVQGFRGNRQTYAPTHTTEPYFFELM